MELVAEQEKHAQEVLVYLVAPQMHPSPVTVMMSGPMTHAEPGNINLMNAMMDQDGMTYIDAMAISHKEDGGKEVVLAAVATPILICGQTMAVYAQQDGTVMGRMQLVTEGVLVDIVLNL